VKKKGSISWVMVETVSKSHIPKWEKERLSQKLWGTGVRKRSERVPVTKELQGKGKLDHRPNPVAPMKVRGGIGGKDAKRLLGKDLRKKVESMPNVEIPFQRLWKRTRECLGENGGEKASK